MNDWIDKSQSGSFSKEIYEKAVGMYRFDHESFFLSQEISLSAEEALMALHKAKSGSKLLGLLNLTSAIEDCENLPEDHNLRLRLAQVYHETMLFVDNYLIE